jgi:large subunit ribosomal protein L4
MPKKMHRAALRSALSVKANAGQIVIVDGLALNEPKTKSAVTMLKALGVNDQSVLVVTADKDAAVWRSFANLPEAKTLVSGFLNVRDLLGYDTVILAKAAVEQVESWLGVESGDAGEPATAQAEG